MAIQTYTREALIRRVLVKLGVLGSGQSAAAEDSQTVDDQLDSVIAKLYADEIVYVGNLEDIEPEIFQNLATLVAATLRDEFGAELNDTDIAEAEAALRAYSVSGPTYQPLVVEYF